MGKGAKTVVSGYTYNGSNAQVICVGPVDILHQITNGDTVVFQGPIFRSSADSDGKTILNTTIGTIRFYWGSATQNADSILSTIFLDSGAGPITAPMPPWRNICYAVNVDVDFGQQVTPPTLLFDVSKFPSALDLEGRVTRITVTNGGSGYSSAPSVSFSGGDGSGVTAHAVVAGGVVTDVIIDSFGTGYTVPPSVLFGGPGSGAIAVATLFHEINGDAILPEVFYDLLTNNLFGTGLDPDRLDTETFLDAAVQIIIEGLGVSPVIDENSNVREVLGKLLQYIDGAFYLKAGKIAFALIRRSGADAESFDLSAGNRIAGIIDAAYTARLFKFDDGLGAIFDGTATADDHVLCDDLDDILGNFISDDQASYAGADIVHLDEADFVDEPQPENRGFADTWNFTLLRFTDRNNKWETATEPYDDPANSALVQESVPKEISLPYITDRDVAKQVAKNIGIKGGLPPVIWNVRVLPKHDSIQPSQVLLLSYAKRNIVRKLVRCMEKNGGSPSAPEIELVLLEEMTRITDNDYVPPADAFEVDPRISDNGTGEFDLISATPRLLILPTDLKAGKADGWLTAINRPDKVTDTNKTFWTFDEVKVPFQQVDTRLNFPIKGELVAWWKFRSDANWILRIRLPEPFDFDALANLGGNSPDFYFVAARRIVKEVGSPQDEHQVDGLWCRKIEYGYFLPQSATVYDIEVDDETFGSLGLLLETTGAPGNFPTLHCYLGRKEDFTVIVSDSIRFERDGPNAPALGGLTLITHGVPIMTYDNNLKRIVKVTVANYAQEQSLGDVVSTFYDRDDFTMCAAGTLERDWGAFAPTGYELFDTSGGERVDPGTENADYPYVFDLDEALGAVFDDLTTTDQQALLSESIDLVLGYMVENNSLIYNDAP